MTCRSSRTVLQIGRATVFARVSAIKRKPAALARRIHAARSPSHCSAACKELCASDVRTQRRACLAMACPFSCSVARRGLHPWLGHAQSVALNTNPRSDFPSGAQWPVENKGILFKISSKSCTLPPQKLFFKQKENKKKKKQKWRRGSLGPFKGDQQPAGVQHTCHLFLALSGPAPELCHALGKHEAAQFEWGWPEICTTLQPKTL